MQIIPNNAAEGLFARHGLPRSTPEAQGISSAEIMRFIETAENPTAYAGA